MTPLEPQLPSEARVVATGFTTALLGDERTLREFIIGETAKTQIEQSGGRAALCLFNDSYDPLTYRQLRVGVNKDERLLRRFEAFCGRPISEIPDPFECHEHYSRHFEQALINRLAALGIHPTVVDSYEAYRAGRYAELIAKTFHAYEDMQRQLTKTFGEYMAADLFRVQCPSCQRLDGTHVEAVRGSVIRFACEPCRDTVDLEMAEVKGKFSWKVECAARWNLYGIDVEVFSKSHLAELGSVPVAGFLSRTFFGARIPEVVPYGDVTISRDLSGTLIDILPPSVLTALFAAQPKRDLHLTRSFVEGFCSNYPVRNTMSYVDYIRQELPFQALCDPQIAAATEAGPQAIGSSDLIAYGNRFSRFYYGKEYKLPDPSDEHLASPDEAILHVAYRVIDYALSARKTETGDWKAVKSRIRSYLAGQPLPKSLYRYLRTAFGQSDGPNVTTLLAILPEMFLRKITKRLSERIHQPRTKAA